MASRRSCWHSEPTNSLDSELAVPPRKACRSVWHRKQAARRRVPPQLAGALHCHRNRPRTFRQTGEVAPRKTTESLGVKRPPSQLVALHPCPPPSDRNLSVACRTSQRTDLRPFSPHRAAEHCRSTTLAPLRPLILGRWLAEPLPREDGCSVYPHPCFRSNRLRSRTTAVRRLRLPRRMPSNPRVVNADCYLRLWAVTNPQPLLLLAGKPQASDVGFAQRNGFVCARCAQEEIRGVCRWHPIIRARVQISSPRLRRT